MPERYKRSFAPEVELTDEELEHDGQLPNPDAPDTSLNAEEQNWKKRYGDLRSHSQRQLNALTAKIEALEAQVKSSTADNFQLPTSEAEVEAWAKRYPQIAAIVETIALTKARKVEENVEGRLKTIQDREAQNEKKEAQLELAKIHPDFFDKIVNAEEFHTWLGAKSKRTQDSIYENDTDYMWAAETVTAFKLETNFGKAKPKPDGRQNTNAARDVPARGRTTPGNGNEPIFTESQILAMNPRDYEANEEAIERAQREGRIEYDIEAAR